MIASEIPIVAENPGPTAPDPDRVATLLRRMRAEVVAVADERESIPDRAEGWACDLKPKNPFDAWLVFEVSMLTLRIDRIERVARRRRLRRALRAALCWDDDRRIVAEEVGAGLAADPVAVRLQLERTPQGCDWLTRRWSLLARFARRPDGWDVPRRTLAVNLLAAGAPDDPRPAGGDADRFDDPLAVALAEVDRLGAVKAAVAEQDAFDRATAEADLGDDDGPQARAIRRDEAALHHRLRWCLQQLRNPRPGAGADVRIFEAYFTRPEPPEPELGADPVPPAEVDEPPAPEPLDDPADDDLPRPAPAASRRHRRARAARLRKADPGRDPDRRT